ILWPLDRHVGEARRWLICPDASLWLVPWAALPLRDGALAVEKYRLSYLVSGRDLLAPAPPPGAEGGGVVADPDFRLTPAGALAEAKRLLKGGAAVALRSHVSERLRSVRWQRLPGTAAEAEAITPRLRKYLGGEPKVYTGRQALEQV